MKQIDESEFRQKLRAETDLVGVQNWAEAQKVSASFVYDTLRGSRQPSEKLARALGYRRVVRFEKVSETE